MFQAWSTRLALIVINCRIEPARDSGVSDTVNVECADVFASRLAPTGESVVGWGLGYFVVIQRAIHRQFGEHDDLLDRQNRSSLREFDVGGDVAGHEAGLCQ